MTKKPIKRVVLRASNPSPRATNLEGYTKFTIPWNDGTGENLYVWIKPDESSQTVYIGSDENLKIQTRQKNLVFKTNTAGVVSAYQSQATLEVIQTNAVYNYRLILSSTSTSVHAAGAELPLTAQLEAKIGDEIIYTKAVEATFTLEDSEGFTLQGSTLSVANRGTYIGNQRSCIVSAVVNAPETGEEVFGNLQINQEGNYIEDVEWEGGSFSYDGIGAGATSATPKVTEMTPRFHYTSGQSSAVVPSSTYGTWEVPAVAYSLAKSQNGFTAVNTDTGVLTATHRGTTIGNARASATVSRLKSGTWTPSANFNAKGSKTAEDTLTATCTQAKNVPTAITSVPTFSYAAGALAPYGGTKNVSVSGKVTITWSSGSTSEESTSGAKAGFSVQGTRTYSMVAATGFSINSSTGAVTAATMGTTLGSRSSGNVTSTLKWVLTINDTYGGGELTDSKSSTLTTPVTQGVNERTQVFAKPNILTFTAADIPASGGSVSFGTITYKQLSTWDYTSGATLTGPEYTTGGTITYGDPVSAKSLGTTAKARTEAGILTAKVTLNGQTSAEGEVAVFQAANAITEYGNVSLTVQTPVSCDALGGDYRINPIYSQTIKYTSGSTRAGNVSVTYTQKAAMTGFSLSGNIVTVTENKTTSARNGYTVTVKATGEGSKTASKGVVFNQSLGVKSYATPVITGFTYPTIAAKGGTVTPTVTYSQTWGWNESTTNGGTITSGAALSFSGTGVNTSTGAVTAGTKGTTVSSATNVTTATVKVTLNNKAATKTFTVQQEANAITSYGAVTISGGTVSDIPAKGGSVSSMSGISASQTITYTSESTRAGTVKITYSTAVSGTSLGTTIKNRTKLGTLTATATGEGSKTATKALDVYQAKNVPTSVSVSAHSYSYPTGAIPAAGGTKTPSSSSTLTVKFSSGATKAERSGDKEGYTLTVTRTYSMVAATGFSINTSTGVITATNRATTEGAARSCGNTSRKVVWTCTIDSTYGGGTISDSDTKTLTTPVSQAANTLSYSYANPTVTVAAVSDIPASGGTKSSSTLTYKQIRTNSYSSGSSNTTELTSGGTVSWSTAISGSNLGTTAKARTKLGTLTATVTMNGKSGTGSIDVYQQANAITGTTYSNPTVSISSVADIPAKGGSVSTGTATYSQTKTDTYTSGSSKPTTLTSGGTVKWSTVSAATKGTTVSARTEVDEITCTVTLNSKSGSATKMVYQAANSKNEVSRVITVSVPSGDIPAEGGTKTVTRSGVINYSFTSEATTTSSFTPTLSIKGDGFSLSGTTVTAANRTTVVGERRFATVTASYTGATSKEVTVWQQANATTTITYGTPTVTLRVSDIPASGGSVSSGTVTYSQSRTQNYTSGATSPMSALTTGGIVSYSTKVSGTGLGTTIKNRTKLGTLTATVTMNGKSGSKSADVYQVGNYVTAVDLTGFAISYSKSVSAAGGTVSPSVTQGSVKFTFTSGASSSTTPSSTYGSLTSSVTYSGSASNGFSVPNSSSGAMTSTDRAKTEGAARNSGTVTATKKVTWTPASSYNGGGTKTDSMSDTDYATQVANVKTDAGITYGTWQVSVSANRYTTQLIPCPASGGTCTITASASRTRTQNYSYTSGDTSTETLSNETATPTMSASGTGLSISGTTATWATRGVIVGERRSGTITATYSGVSKSVTLYQQANSVTSTTYGNPVVTITSVADIPASGGSVNTGSCTYSQSRTYIYSSGSTLAGLNLVSGGSVSWSTVSAGSKGTTLSGRTSAGTITCTVTLNGKSGSKTATVYQAANEVTSSDFTFVDSTTNVLASGEDPFMFGLFSTFNITFSSGEGYKLGDNPQAAVPDWVLQLFTLTPGQSYTHLTSMMEGYGVMVIGSVDANSGAQRPVSGSVKFNPTEESWNFSTYQNAGYYLNVSPTSMSFTASGGTKTLTIDTNESWTIS